jgi:hypothetical protein
VLAGELGDFDGRSEMLEVSVIHGLLLDSKEYPKLAYLQ